MELHERRQEIRQKEIDHQARMKVAMERYIKGRNAQEIKDIIVSENRQIVEFVKAEEVN